MKALLSWINDFVDVDVDVHTLCDKLVGIGFEVEEVIYTLPEVLECAVVGVEDSLRGQAVCAFIVLKEGMEGDKKAMRKYLLEHLALYKVPRHYFFIEKMPKNGTGKIVKPTLREMAAALVQKV